jgi:hypothetical protein
MRKKAAIDLKHQQEQMEKKRREVRYGKNGERIYTLHSLPSSMIHIGDCNIVRICCFSGLTRVDIRKFVQDEQGGLHPSTDGVSISPEVWENLQSEFCRFLDTRSTDILIMKRELCLSRHLEDGEPVFSLQRLFQRKDRCFEFIPKRIMLKSKHLNKLENCAEDISRTVKEQLLKYTLDSFVKKELQNSPQTNTAEVEPENSEGFTELLSVLVKILKKHVTAKIYELFPCRRCEDPDEISFAQHDCVNTDPKDNFSYCFPTALYKLDWEEVSREFVRENVDNCHFTNLIFVFDFFLNLNVGDVFKAVENLYIDQEGNNLYDNVLNICE